MTTDETAAEVNVFEVVLFGLEVGDLADVVAGIEVSDDLSSREYENSPDCVEQTP